MTAFIVRAGALCGVLLCLVVCADTLRHRQFESGVVATVAAPNYFVHCEGLQFDADHTIAIVRIIDSTPHPQFDAFRRASSHPPSPSLYIPANYRVAAGWLRFVRYDDMPDLVVTPKADNDIHEATLKIIFEPIGKLRRDPFEIDKMYLGFPGFAPFEIKRRAPLSQSQSTWATLHNSIVGAVSPAVARTFLFIGAFSFCGITVDLYRQRKMLVYRWKFRQLSAKGERVHQGQDEPKADGEVLAPPKWDERIIALRIRDLAHRPGLVGVFIDGICDRFIARQDEKTAAARIKFLRLQLEELQVRKELQKGFDELKFRLAELEIRGLELKLKRNDLTRRLETEAELRDAEHQRDLLRVKLESAQFKKQMRDLKPTPPAPPTRSRRQEILDRVQRLKEKLAYVRETHQNDPDERRRLENQYEDKIAQLQDELDGLE